MQVPSILIVEDDPAIRGLLVAALKREALRIDTAADGLEALEKIRDEHYTLLVVDLMMPRMNGMDFIAVYTDLPESDALIFVITAYDDRAIERLAPEIASRVHAVVHKPFDVEWFVEILRECAWAASPPKAPLGMLDGPSRRDSIS